MFLRAFSEWAVPRVFGLLLLYHIYIALFSYMYKMCYMYGVLHVWDLSLTDRVNDNVLADFIKFKDFSRTNLYSLHFPGLDFANITFQEFPGRV